MANPVLVEVTRGSVVESRHRGAACVFDGDGNTVLSTGDCDRSVFPRSAIKAVQALPLVESGAADAFGFGDRELSLACSSHSGEAEHVAMARSMLERAGLDESCLECGGHWSSHQSVLLQQSKIYDINQIPPAVCNNCSGKHSGFVCTAAHLGIDTTSYVHADHTIQKTVRHAMEDVTGAAHSEDMCGTDGCSIPTYAIPLSRLAHGFARMATGRDLGPMRATAARRLLEACMAEPFYMAGTKRFCTGLMQLGRGRLFAKTGAEGVFCGAIPELGLGIALKCDDGGTRAAEVMMAAVVSRLLAKDDELQPQLQIMSSQTLTNRNAIEVGVVRAVLPG